MRFGTVFPEGALPQAATYLVEVMPCCKGCCIVSLTSVRRYRRYCQSAEESRRACIQF